VHLPTFTAVPDQPGFGDLVGIRDLVWDMAVLPRDGAGWQLKLRVQVEATPQLFDRLRGGRETRQDVE